VRPESMADIDLDNYYSEVTYDREKGVKAISHRPKLDEDELKRRKAMIQEELYNILHKYRFED
jgi:hypothetical protein